MPSFDIVSKVNPMELDNAINQAKKELASRFDFRGVIELESRNAFVFETRDNTHRLQSKLMPLSEVNPDNMPPGIVAQASEEVELLEAAGAVYDRERFLAGEVSPVFFGSALTNYGVEEFLRGFLRLLI